MADENELLLKISADLSSLKDSLEQAKNDTKESADSMKESFAEVGKMIAEVFAFEKIKGFVEESIQSFAAVERSMNTLGSQVEANGGNWDALKDSVDQFLVSQQAMYGHTKEETLPVLNQLYSKTHDMATSMKLLDDANKLTLLGIGEMTGNAKMLGEAFTGSGKGVNQLGKALGLTKEQSKDATIVFDTLTKKMKTVGDVSGDTQSKINGMSVSWSEDMEHVGESLAPALDFLHILEKAFINLIDGFISGGKIIILAITGIVYGLGQLAEAVTHPFSIKSWKDFASNMKDTFHATTDSITEEANGLNKKLASTWSDDTKAQKLESDKQLANQAIALAAKNAAAKASSDKIAADDATSQALMDQLDAQNSQHEMTRMKSAQEAFDQTIQKKERGIKDMFNNISQQDLQYDKKHYENAKKNLANEEKLMSQALTKEAKAKLKSVLAENKMYVDLTEKKMALNAEYTSDAIAKAQEIEAFSKQSTATIASGFDQMFTQMEAGTLTMGKAFEDLGKAMGKALLQPIIDYLTQLGEVHIAKGIGELISEDYVAGAEDIAAGVLYIGAAEGVKAASSYYLADGGIVNGPTHFVAGEGADPELVLPLNQKNMQQYGIGGKGSNGMQIANININVNNPRNANDLVKQLPKALTTMQRRLGNRQGTL